MVLHVSMKCQLVFTTRVNVTPCSLVKIRLNSFETLAHFSALHGVTFQKGGILSHCCENGKSHTCRIRHSLNIRMNTLRISDEFVRNMDNTSLVGPHIWSADNETALHRNVTSQPCMARKPFHYLGRPRGRCLPDRRWDKMATTTEVRTLTIA